jgi:hypothetical protein
VNTDKKKKRGKDDGLLRDDVEIELWTPQVQKLDEQEIEKLDQSLDRQQR